MTTTNKLQTVDVHTKEWKSPMYGTTYFSCVIKINEGCQDEQVYVLPYQYGYGDQSLFDAFALLQELYPDRVKRYRHILYGNWDANYKKERCKQKEVKEHGLTPQKKLTNTTKIQKDLELALY